MKVKKTCKLYRNIHDIINPSISRKNISEYQIILDEKLIPIQVFYPEINTKLDKIVIYLHGNEICNDFYEEFAYKTGNIVFLLEYSGENSIEEIEKVFKYIVDELDKCGIKNNNITLVGDFKGADFILELSELEDIDYYNSINKILLSPKKLELSKFNIKKALVLSNNEEQKKGKNMTYYLLEESIYDFIHDIDLVLNEKIYKYIVDYIGS